MHSSYIFILLFIGIPIFELYLLITIGKLIGVWPTIFVVIFTAIVGVQLLRIQGLATLQRVQNTLAQGQVPAEALIEGLLLLIGGALLLTPGFFTDAIGFMCLLPLPRMYLARWLNHYIQTASFSQTTPSQTTKKQGMTVEGECRREDDD
jgi:UPF0716 protein FxsA